MKFSTDKLKKIKKRWLLIGLAFILLFCAWQIISAKLKNNLEQAYLSQSSQIIFDRNGKLIETKPNNRGYYDEFVTAPPPRLTSLLLKKEDRFFYFHPGFNPFSWARDFFTWALTGKRSGSSTITQQLVKTLLTNENQRTWQNKISELFYTESLEWQLSKKEILTMYLNSAYFGNLSQGIKQASTYYFNTPPENLTDAQIISLLAALNSPSQLQPLSSANIKEARSLAKNFRLNIPDGDWQTVTAAVTNENSRTTTNSFEANTLNLNCNNNCHLTLDSELNNKVREILKRNLNSTDLDTANNGAVVVIKLPENELLGMVGSPEPTSQGSGMQLNMAIKPRPIGSTSKPFIYMNAFQQGARPYSLVDDTEIKYQVGTGFDFFPKNFDGQYRGLVTLHQALDNSLNIPSVQVLTFVGLNNFYSFLSDKMGFVPLQPLDNYQLGIALGGLEMDPLTLAHYFTIFPQEGWLKPLKIYQSGNISSPFYQTAMEKPIDAPKQVGKQDMVQMVNRILNDRNTGVDQFGIRSNLNLPYPNYALKTGTSRDYHDSWTVGYTADFLVAVWVGNSDNKAMRQITGLSGAAKIWREVMSVLYNSAYNKNTPFNFNKTSDIQSGNTLDIGLTGDNYDIARNIMLSPTLISSPHDGDKYLLLPGTTIPFTSSSNATWTVNGKTFGSGQSLQWPPPSVGDYTIEAKTNEGEKQQINITINKE